MELRELAVQYRQAAADIRKRTALLQEQLSRCSEGSTRAMALRRRINLLSTMAAETSATAKYMENYYERDDRHGRMGEAKLGISSFEELCTAIGNAGRGEYAHIGRGAQTGYDSKAAGNGKTVLSGTDETVP